MNAELGATWGFDGDDLTTKVARAIYGVGVAKVRESVSKIDLEIDRLNLVFERALIEADRSSSILIFALIEDIMIASIKKNLFCPMRGSWDDVTGGNGLLATANDRLDLISILGWLQERTYKDILILKSIRNRFAHHADVLDFSDPKMMSWISNLFGRESHILKMYPQFVSGELKLSWRHLYLIRAILVVEGLIADLTIAPLARVERVAVQHAHGGTWEDSPENLKALRRLAARHILIVLRNYVAVEGDAAPV